MSLFRNWSRHRNDCLALECPALSLCLLSPLRRSPSLNLEFFYWVGSVGEWVVQSLPAHLRAPNAMIIGMHHCTWRAVHHCTWRAVHHCTWRAMHHCTWRAMYHCTWRGHGVMAQLGFKFRSTCLHSKCLAHWALSLAINILLKNLGLHRWPMFTDVLNSATDLFQTIIVWLSLKLYSFLTISLPFVGLCVLRQSWVYLRKTWDLFSFLYWTWTPGDLLALAS